MISQSVACSQHHSLEQRLARWLLTMHGYAGTRELVMDHQSIAAMLGVRRVGVSETAHRFRTTGLIDYRRGRIAILDAPGLEKRACECYRFIRREYGRLEGALPRLLSRHSAAA